MRALLDLNLFPRTTYCSQSIRILEANRIHGIFLTFTKVIKMVLVILLVFLICWVPLQILILYAQFSHNSKESGEVFWFLNIYFYIFYIDWLALYLIKLPQWYDHVMFLVYSIAYTNSTLNPLLYGGLNQTYRKTLIRVLCRKCCQCREGRDSFMSIQGKLTIDFLLT